MKRLVVAAALVGGLFAGSGNAAEGGSSADSNKLDINSTFSAFGVSEKRSINQKSCRVTADIKQDEFIKSVPLLQKLDLLNSDMSATKIRSQPTKIALAFAVQIASIEMKQLFDDEKSIDRCSFVQNLTFTDEYGNDKTIPMFTYDFDRGTYTKINWDKFQSPNLIKVAKNFKFAPEVAARTAEEPD